MDPLATSTQAADKRRLLEQRLRSGIEALTQANAAAVAVSTPTLSPADADVYEPFPLTDMQEAYWLGRQTVFELGGTSIHSYRETEIEDLDLERLNTAWWTLVQRHAALRSVVTQSGTQRIVQDPPRYEIPLVDLRGHDPDAIQANLAATRQEMSHRLFPLDTWPQWEIRATRIDDRLTRLHVGFDGMLIDDRSYQIVIREWFTLYEAPTVQLPGLEYSFRDYVLAERAGRESPAYARALDYWRRRVAHLPDSARLPLAKSFRTVAARFGRYGGTLDRDEWGRLKQLCVDHQITPAGLLLACFMEVLGRWSRSRELTVNVPTLNRPPFHEQINNVVGDFSSFLLIGNDGLTSGVFLERIRGIQQRLWDGLQHDSVSGVRIIRELTLQQKRAPGSIQMPVVFTMASSLRERQARAETKTARADVLYGITQTPQVYLDHQAAEMQDALHFNWDVIEELFQPGLMRALFESYCRLLRQLAADESILGHPCPVAIPEEQKREREQANATDAAIPDGLLHTFGGALDRETAQGPAVISDRRTLSHRELVHMSEALAERLVQEQVRPNELVAIVADKGWEQVVAARAIVASGAAYLPVAADLPADYREKLLERARVRIVVTQREHLPAMQNGGRVHIAVEDPPDSETPVRGDVGFAARSRPDDLAYVNFTSGSTGEPKGVMITHRSAVNTVHDINARFSVTSRDRVLAISSLSFDLSVYDIFGALAVGAAVVVPASGTLRDTADLLRLIHEHGVTVWNSVPALIELLVQYAEDTNARLPASLRLVMMSGDRIPVGLPDRIRALCDRVEVVSLGGATEAAIWSIVFPIDTVDPSWSSIPYGRPLTNQRVHVLDADDRDCPVWVPGRLFIEGTGLAAGYWGDRAETDRRFRLRAGTATRIYDTGDWALYQPGGVIEFLGGDDRQVKINGFRVELDEIEAHLSRHHAVARAAVFKSTANQLMAAVVPRDASCSASGLKAYLSERLPAYMVPVQFELFDHLPLTSNGKLDYAAVQRDAGRLVVAPPSGAPTDRRGQQLLEDIREILGLEQLDTRQSLIAHGAGSLQIVRLSNRARAYADGRLKLQDYFEAPSIDALLAAFEDRAPTAIAAAPDRSVVRARPSRNGELSAAIAHASAGLRTDLQGTPAVQLIRQPEQDPSLWNKRRSHRQYALRPLGFQAVSRLLQPLASFRSGETVRYRYGSASSLYPVQVYLHVKQGRVSGLLGGDYYYHPEQRRLFELNRDGGFHRDVYGDRNRPIYDQAAFCLLLVCPLDTVEAFYGEYGYDLAMYEAGSIGQLLRDAAPPLGIGMCSIGTLDFARIRARFRVDARHVLLHSFVCGAIGDGVVEADAPVSEFDRATLLLQRIEALSDAEAQHLDSCLPGDAR